jgi:CRP-like cAMP-binding protein
VLDASAQSLVFEPGEEVFRQHHRCLGLYVVIAGQFLRRAERHEARLVLGSVRAGDLVELAAVLGDGQHTYSLRAQTAGSMLLIPIDALSTAFQEYPLMRLRLLAEQAREVSRAYDVCKLTRNVRTRRTAAAGPA